MRVAKGMCYIYLKADCTLASLCCRSLSGRPLITFCKERSEGVRFMFLTELEQELHKKPQRTCIVKMMSTRNLWKNIVVLCVNS